MTEAATVQAEEVISVIDYLTSDKLTIGQAIYDAIGNPLGFFKCLSVEKGILVTFDKTLKESNHLLISTHVRRHGKH